MTMTGTFYLILSEKRQGYRVLGARLTTKAPALAPGEVSMLLDVELPESLFKRPSLKAKVTVPDEQVGQPFITADVADNVAAVLSEQLGLHVRVSAEPAEHSDV